MSNHPIFLDVETLTSQILPTPSPTVDNAEILKSFSPQLPPVPKPLKPFSPWMTNC